jgi:hypothetical protein
MRISLDETRTPKRTTHLDSVERRQIQTGTLNASRAGRSDIRNRPNPSLTHDLDSMEKSEILRDRSRLYSVEQFLTERAGTR